MANARAERPSVRRRQNSVSVRSTVDTAETRLSGQQSSPGNGALVDVRLGFQSPSTGDVQVHTSATKASVNKGQHTKPDNVGGIDMNLPDEVVVMIQPHRDI